LLICVYIFVKHKKIKEENDERNKQSRRNGAAGRLAFR